MAGQINVNYDKVTEIINKMYGGFFVLYRPRLPLLGRRDENGGLTAGVVNSINGLPERSDAPHYLMNRLEVNTARMLQHMADEMRAADDAASVK